MPRAKLSRKSKYYVPQYLYKECVYFCMQYPQWVMELSTDGDPSKGVSYDKEKIQTSGPGDSTAVIAMRRHIIEKKKKLVDDTLNECIPAMLIPWILMGVTTDVSVWALQSRGMPISHNTYFEYRRKFYYELSKKI